MMKETLEKNEEGQGRYELLVNPTHVYNVRAVAVNE